MNIKTYIALFIAAAVAALLIINEVVKQRIAITAKADLTYNNGDYSDDPEMDSIIVIPTTVIENNGKHKSEDNVFEIGSDYVKKNDMKWFGKWSDAEFKDGEGNMFRSFYPNNWDVVIEVHNNKVFFLFYEGNEDNIIDVWGYRN